MTFLRKIFGNLAAFIGHPVPMYDDPKQLFTPAECAEMFEAIGRIAAGTAGRRHYLVCLRSWVQLLYRGTVGICRALGYLIYRARCRFFNRHQANNQER